MINNVPFLVVGVMQPKAQDSSYSGRDKDKAFIPDTTYKGLFGVRYVSNFVFQAADPRQVPDVTGGSTRCSAGGCKFDASDKEAIGMWDTTEAHEVPDGLLHHLPRLPGCDRLLHPDGRRHRRLEHHVRGDRGAHPRDRREARRGREAALHPEPVPGGDAHPHRHRGPARLRRHARHPRGLPAAEARRLRRDAAGLAGRHPHHRAAARRDRLLRRLFPRSTGVAARPRRGARNSHEIRQRRDRPGVAAVPCRPRSPAQAHRAHRGRHRLGHAVDRAAALVRRGPEAFLQPRARAAWARASPSSGRAPRPVPSWACPRAGASSRARRTSSCCAAPSPRSRRSRSSTTATCRSRSAPRA